LTEVIHVEAAGHDLRHGRFDQALFLAAVERQIQSATD
jgi:hypothetical protein